MCETDGHSAFLPVLCAVPSSADVRLCLRLSEHLQGLMDTRTRSKGPSCGVNFVLNIFPGTTIHCIYPSPMKIAVFWDVAPCGSCECRNFRGTSSLHLQNTKLLRARSSVSIWLAHCRHWFLLLRRWWWHVPPRRPFSTDVHGATSQKTALFIVTAMKTSNRT
jgi:hypothetical protein